MMNGLTGIVLAGGQSRRMGRDKAGLLWDDGEDWLHRVLRRMLPVCDQLIVVGNQPRKIFLPQVELVPDTYVGCGPLGGMEAGLRMARYDYSFVTACDMIFVSAAAISRCRDAAKGFDAAVPFVDGHFHPLHGVYHRRCLNIIEDLLKGGVCRITELYQEISLRRVEEEELRVADPALRTLLNINTPEEAAQMNVEFMG